MTKAFIERIKREGIVDTRRYRYFGYTAQNATEQWFEVRRFPIECVGRLAMLNKHEWEKVYEEH